MNGLLLLGGVISDDEIDGVRRQSIPLLLLASLGLCCFILLLVAGDGVKDMSDAGEQLGAFGCRVIRLRRLLGGGSGLSRGQTFLSIWCRSRIVVAVRVELPQPTVGVLVRRVRRARLPLLALARCLQSRRMNSTFLLFS